MYQELTSALEHAAPFLSMALSTVNPIAGTIVNVLAHTFNADPKDVPDIAHKIAEDNDSDSKLSMIDKLLSTSPASLVAQRQPSKVDLHLVIEYPGVSDVKV